EPRLDAVAVELDLVRPAEPAWRGRMQGGERRRHEIRERRVAWPPVLVLALAGAAAAAFLRSGPIARGAGALLRAFLRNYRRMAFRRAGLDVLLHAFVRVPNPFAALALGDLGDRSAADRRQRLLLEDIWVARAAGGLILGLDQKPGLLLFSRPAVHAHEMPASVQLLALEGEVEMALLVSGVRIAFRMPAPAVPNHDRAAAVLSLRDSSLECVVFDGMVFHVDRETLLARNETRAASHGPTLHDPAKLEPQVIRQTPCGVLLDDELVSFGPTPPPPRLGGDVEFAFPAIYLKPHRSARVPGVCRGALESGAIPCSASR